MRWMAKISVGFGCFSDDETEKWFLKLHVAMFVLTCKAKCGTLKVAKGLFETVKNGDWFWKAEHFARYLVPV